MHLLAICVVELNDHFHKDSLKNYLNKFKPLKLNKLSQKMILLI